MLVMVVQIIMIMVDDGDHESDSEDDAGVGHVCEGDVDHHVIDHDRETDMSLCMVDLVRL
jgi:hypothetical protein